MALTDKLTAIADAVRSKSGKTEKLTPEQMAVQILDLQALTFRLVGNPCPEQAREHTIWLDTDETITGWVFSAAEPEAPAEGMVWIFTGTSSPVAFNAVEKETILLYPFCARQYLAGAWVSKSAKIWLEGRWVDWATFLYRTVDGDNGALTGGWTYTTTRAAAESLTINAEQFRVYVYNNDQTGLIYPYSKKTVDLSQYTRLGITVESMTSVKDFKFGVGSSSSFSSYTSVAALGTHYCDISGINGFANLRMQLECLYGSHGTVVISKLWLEG